MSRPTADLLLATLLAVLITTGCGPAGPDLAPVTGTVTYRNQPVKKGTITFEPPNYRSARGQILDGAIVNVMTHEEGDGAAVGTHRVFIHAFVREPIGMEIVPSAIPDRYSDPSTSGLEREIKSGEENVFHFELTD